MKVAVFSESPSDEAAMWIVMRALRGDNLERVAVPASLRTHGWPSVRDLLPSTLRYLFYRTDADGLVVLADSDHTPLHVAAHDQPGGYDPACRLCELRTAGGRTLDELHAQISGRKMRLAIALAVPAVEAWWRCGIDVHATEQAWSRGLPAGPFPFTRSDLKRAIYGTDRPSLPVETEKMAASAQRLSGDLSSLERHFPVGFGSFASDFRSW
jgi:hypothetical protein